MGKIIILRRKCNGFFIKKIKAIHLKMFKLCEAYLAYCFGHEYFTTFIALTNRLFCTILWQLQLHIRYIY